MRTITGFATGAITAAIAGLAPLAAFAAPPADPVAVTHVIGNPEAEVRLVEYVSYTCPHCAAFETEAGDFLRLAYAATNKMGIEIRHLVRDPVDLTVALLAHCGDEDRFVANHSAFMRSQEDWMTALSRTTPARRARYVTGNYAARHRAIARDGGLYEVMKKRGYQAIEVDRCLADEGLARALAESTQAYVSNGVRSTPSFAMDGALIEDVHTWEALRPLLEERMKR